MNNIFTKHPKSVGETYLQHLYHAMSFSCLLFSLSLKALVHAVLPFCYETAVSNKIKSLSDEMQKRKDDARREIEN